MVGSKQLSVATRVWMLSTLPTLLVAPAMAASLRGTDSSLDRQNRVARQHDFTFLRNSSQVRQFVDDGYLVPVEGNNDYQLHRVSFPYARPEVKLFIERLGRHYRKVCREPLVITSLTRPLNRQPRNASPRSVHPTGMAFDLRRSWSRSCRRWLEQALLSMENAGVLEAGYERRPPHYHVAVFFRRYTAWAARHPSIDDPLIPTDRYIVTRGDTLWKIARRRNTTVDTVKRANGLRSSRIYPGQVLKVPASD